MDEKKASELPMDSSHTNNLTIDIYRPSLNKDSEYENEGKRIKSFAFDLHSTVSVPPQLSLLQSNTDLNTPPPNWLLSQPRKIVGPAVSRNPKSNDFASFHMASSFLDSMGEVDVVSDAENIKKLLKIPYSKGAVSMMVHRVGNTLLLDEFDIHTHLLRAAENEWGWLKKFYLEHMFASCRAKQKATEKKPSRHSRDYLQQQNLISKFLCHSIALNESQNTETQVQDRNHQVQPITDPLGDPAQEENNVHDDTLPQFSKNIIWTFEDLRMLIGTDMPIFGGGTHPCLSLRLRDMSKPINVLTGLDYWLDNLMCNVPEVVMCYHLGGLVQKYELIKTDDLPRLPGSQFKPGIIKDVAQNILSFLKSKATKAGHTYWLFKAKDDDIVKLYDLTSLCNDLNEDINQNPFTTPVAMLLFKVARNLKMSSDWKRHQGTVLALLKNCLSLLDAAKYPQIATAALYYVSDVYLPTSLKVPETEENPEEVEEEWADDWEEPSMGDQFSASVDVAALSTPQQVRAEEENVRRNVRPTVGDNWEQRCTFALQHAVEALEFLSDQSKSAKPSEEEPSLASPLKPIPMPYQTLKQPPLDGISGSLMFKEPQNEWKQQYWRLLMEKCRLAHITLAEEARKNCLSEPEKILSHLRMAALLWVHLDPPGLPLPGLPQPCVPRNSTSSVSLQSHALGLAGDVYFSMVQRWNEVASPPQSVERSSVNERLLRLLTNLQLENTLEDYFQYPTSLHEALQFSLEHYRLALASFSALESSSASDVFSFAKRLGNVCNEMGVFFMSKASAVMEEGGADWKRKFVELYQISQQHLEEGRSVFRTINDNVNLALLSCNLAKLHRLQARALAPAEKKEASLAEWRCYSKALQCYKQALDALERRELNTGIWDAIIWDYTSVHFTLASLLQDFAPLSIKSREEVEAEIIQLLENCIALSEGETADSRLPLLQYRAATCHYRLASLHHDTYRNGDGESIINGRNVRVIAEQHYSNANTIFNQLEHWDEVIRLQLEKAGIYEFQFKRLTGVVSKMRVLQSILNCYLSTKGALAALVDSNIGGDPTSLETKTLECMTLMCSRIQSTLLQLTKLSRSAKKPNNADAENFRNMYSISLKCNIKQSDWHIQLARTVMELSEFQLSVDKF